MWTFLLIFSACVVKLVVSVEAGYHFSVAHNCSCDTIPGRCDTYCCCDGDCQPQHLQSFNTSCSPDLGQHHSFNCSRNSSIFDSAFHNFLCIHTSNTAFLGDYHDVPAKIETLYDYDQVKSELKTQKTFEAKEAGRELENNTEHYKVGVSIKTIYDATEGIVGKLSLPSQTLLGSCVSSPVRFLKDSKSVCRRPINPEVCLNAKNSYLDHQMFIMSSPVIASEANFAQVLSENNFLRTAESETHYYLTTRLDSYLNVELPAERPHRSVAPENFTVLTEKLSKYKISDSIFQTEEYSSYEKVQSVAHLDPARLDCNNLVLEVKYEFFWSGTQIWKTIFTHKNKSEKLAGQKNKVSRSGNPGYERGKSLVLARRKIKEAEFEFEEDPGGLRVWGSNQASSVCAENMLSELYFGENIISGCNIRLQQSQLENCQDLVADITRVQSSLVRSQYAARGGDRNFTAAPASLLSILRENVTGPTGEGEGCAVPAKLRITVMVVRLEAGGREIFRLNGLRVTPIYQRWTWRCRIARRGPRKCSKVQHFPLSTEVEFLEIPNIWHQQNTSRFWLKQDSIRCNGDICWEDLLAPVGSLHTGDSVAEMVEWTLALILLIPTTLYFYTINKV